MSSAEDHVNSETRANNPPVVTTLSPYYIGTNENTSTSLVNHVLTGPNFHSWRRSMEISIGAKSKLGFVTGSLTCPPDTDPMYGAWLQCNLIVMSWIINSVSMEIGQSILYVDSAAKMWRELTERFAQGNEARIYELHQDIHTTVQNDLSVSAYFTKLETLWNQLSVISPLPRCTCGIIGGCSCNFMAGIVAREHRMFKMILLMGLNEIFAHVRSQILLMKPLPTLNDMYQLVIQDEKQKTLGVHSLNSENTNMALATQHSSIRPYSQNSQSSHTQTNYRSYRPVLGRGVTMKCSHCGSNRHTKDRCYRVHGYPPGWRPRPRGFNNGNGGYMGQTYNVSYQGNEDYGDKGVQSENMGLQQGQNFGIGPTPLHSPYPVIQQPLNTSNASQQQNNKDIVASSNMVFTGMSGPGLLEDDW